MKTYNYPDWLSECNASWEKLSPYIKEFFLRKVGYDLNDDCKELENTQDSENKVKNWLYNQYIDPFIWEALGFHKARAVKEYGNEEMESSREYLLLITWIAKVLYEEGIDNDWWDDTLKKDDFIDQNKWAYAL